MKILQKEDIITIKNSDMIAIKWFESKYITPILEHEGSFYGSRICNDLPKNKKWAVRSKQEYCGKVIGLKDSDIPIGDIILFEDNFELFRYLANG